MLFVFKTQIIRFDRFFDCILELYKHIRDFKPIKNPIVTIGTFDGVHVGHQKIISRLHEIAKIVNGSVVVLTFYPHPRMVLYPDDHNLFLLHTLEEKIEALKNLEVHQLIVQPFDHDFSRLSSIEFVREVLVNTLKLHTLVIGYDHHFGRNREGSINELKELSSVYNFHLEEISEQDINDIAISSTKIRKFLEEGAVDSAKDFLGYYYHLRGKVIEGDKRGRTIGYPTANIKCSDRSKLIPGNGVYAVQIVLEHNIYQGMMNIGHKPTFGKNELSVEVHLFDFDHDIYGKELKVIFINKIRDEIKFNSVEELILQLQADEKTAKSILSSL